MNVLQVVSSFAPAYAYGGPARSAYKISLGLAELGHDVTVYTTDAYDAEQRYDPDKHPFSADKLDVHRFRNLSNKLAYEFNLCFAPGIAKRLRETVGDYDIVHIEEFRTPQAVLAGHYAKQAGVPFVLQTRGAVPRTLKPKQKWVFDKLAGERLFSDAAAIMATSENESDQYFEVFPDTDGSKIKHLPNGADMDIYGEVPERNQFRSAQGLDSETPVVMFVGRLDDMKGIDLLIDAFDRVHSQFPDARLFIVGPDDGLRDELEAQTSDLGLTRPVSFVGPLYDNEKLQAYVDADVFVLPSKYDYESFGNVAVEAMACRTPVVLTDKCGASEWIPSDAGLTVSPSADAIAAGITSILEDESRNEAMARTGRELVVEQLNWKSVAESVEGIYYQVKHTV